MKVIFRLFILFFFIISCNNEPTAEKPTLNERISFSQREATWMKKLSEWNVSRFNDSAKWRLYCYYGDDTCKGGTANPQLQPIPLAFLELKLSFAMYEKDRLSLLYRFIYDDSTEVEYFKNGSKDIVEGSRGCFGVEFDVKADSVIGYTHCEGIFWQSGPMTRYENFTHPDLIRFVNQNTSNLHPWFRKELLRRGSIIK